MKRNYGWQRWNQVNGTIFRITIYCNAYPLTQSAESLMITSNADYIHRRKINLFGQPSTTPSSIDFGSRITGIGSFYCFFFGYCERLRVLGRVVPDQFYFSLANPVHLLLQFLVNHNIRLSVDKVWPRTQFLFVVSILNRCKIVNRDTIAQNSYRAKIKFHPLFQPRPNQPQQWLHFQWCAFPDCT